ncbi:MAG: DeoR/GlpR transcriptional regulator [Chloroflexi bacterium]|nr:DeoR/GlpR transcriptional regulator [Chloroflexota bacterium]
MSDGLFVQERRRIILEKLKQRGRVAVKDLSDLLHVSAVTIRHDLRALEEAGLLERTYGGAVIRSGEPVLQELSFNVRQMKNHAQKDAIAQAAAALVHDGFSIALDSSTSSYALVPHLLKFDRLTIVTNSLVVAQGFLNNSQFRVLMPGGRLRRDAISLVGQPESLPKVNLNLGFFSARGLDDVVGISEIDPDEAVIKRALFSYCVAPVFLIDGSKWGQVAPYTIVPPQQIRHIITSQNAPAELVQRFRSQNVQVDLVPYSDV